MSLVGQPQATQRKRILFMAEAVTLAHVARPHVLALSLPPTEYEVLFASDPRFDRLFTDATYQRRQIRSISSQQFLRGLAQGAPLYDLATLQAYVAEDLSVIDEFRPDAIVGDFRLSLSVSARLRGVPYFAITNAYWSPFAKLSIPVPELPLTRWLGYTMGQAVFSAVRPIAFALHAVPINRLRKIHGLPSLGGDVRWAYTDADTLLFSDISGIVELVQSPAHYRFVGPINWSPPTTPPDWWDEIPSDRPAIYLTLGSSGDERLLPSIVRALAEMPVSILVSTAGRPFTLESYPNVFTADYLSGQVAAERASLIICNGGSPTTYQALAAGKPVVGIPANLDQCLNMATMQAAGVGRILRVANLRPTHLRDTVSSTMDELSRSRLSAIAESIKETDPGSSLRELLHRQGLHNPYF